MHSWPRLSSLAAKMMCPTNLPTYTTLIPADDATNVTPTAPLQINFSENIVKGTGNILIRASSNDAIIQTIDVTSASVTVAGVNATINIAALANSTGYYVEIPAGAFADASANAFAGISGNSTWNFTTSAPPAAGIIGAANGVTPNSSERCAPTPAIAPSATESATELAARIASPAANTAGTVVCRLSSVRMNGPSGP